MSTPRTIRPFLALLCSAPALATPPVPTGLSPATLGPGAEPAPSDTVLVVDTSRFTEHRIDEVGAALAMLMDHVAAAGHPTDRVALVIYAGESYTVDLGYTGTWSVFDPTNPFAPNSVVPPAAPADALVSPILVPEAAVVAEGVRPCDTPYAAWLEAYRFMDPVWDRELAGWGDPLQPPLWDYWVVDPTAAAGLPGTAAPWDDPLMDWGRTFFSGSAALPSETDWDTPLLEPQQCLLWFISEAAFVLEDPRRAPAMQTATSSPLSCHAGHPLRARPERFLTAQRAIAPVTCPYTDGRYTTTGPPYADLAYTQAGSNPAAGLRAAGAVLAAAGAATPRAILVTDGGPRCGPNAEARVDDCAAAWRQALRNSHATLDDAGVRLDVVSLAGVDTDDEATLDLLPTDVGGLVAADAYPSLADALVEAWERGRRSALTRP